MRIEPSRKAIPRQLQNVRSYLGDAGIPHVLRYSKNGFPYVLFDPQGDGFMASVQFRSKIKDPETKEVLRPAAYFLFTPAENGRQKVAQYQNPYDMLEVLGINKERIDAGRDGRRHLDLDERAVSVLDAAEEASLVASMRM